MNNILGPILAGLGAFLIVGGLITLAWKKPDGHWECPDGYYVWYNQCIEGEPPIVPKWVPND